MTQKNGEKLAQDPVAPEQANSAQPEAPSVVSDDLAAAPEVERRNRADNPLRDMLEQIGQAHLEEQIVRAVGAHLARQQSTTEYAFGRPLSRAEARSLSETSTSSSAHFENAGSEALDAEARLAAIEARALPIAEAAKRVGAAVEDYEHRVDAGTLLCLHRPEAGWVLPAFQFCGAGEVPGLTEVLTSIREGASLVLIEAFFMTPQAALPGEDGLPTTPHRWLCQGRDPIPVIELARHV